MPISEQRFGRDGAEMSHEFGNGLVGLAVLLRLKAVRSGERAAGSLLPPPRRIAIKIHPLYDPRYSLAIGMKVGLFIDIDEDWFYALDNYPFFFSFFSLVIILDSIDTTCALLSGVYIFGLILLLLFLLLLGVILPISNPVSHPSIKLQISCTSSPW